MHQAVKDLLELLAIAGPPGRETPVAEYLRAAMQAAGISSDAISQDRAFEGSEYGGECGNLFVRFAGVGDDPRPAMLLAAHMDTVPLAAGCRPRLAQAGDSPDGRPRIVNDAPGTALGGDNRTGCAALLQVARTLASVDPARPRPPITLVFFVQEEVGLVGSRQLDVAALGFDRPAIGFNFDGGRLDQLVTRVIGTTRFEIVLAGVASHAGASPEKGASAAVAAGRAIAWLADNGWHGRIDRPEGRGSSNVGVIRGGGGTNVVMDHLTILAETRSHDPRFRRQIRRQYEDAFRTAAARTTSVDGRPVQVSFSDGPCYESFALADDAPVVQAAVEAARRCGISLRLVSNDGGMDANNLTAKGIPTVTFGLGQRAVHTPDEWIDVDEFLAACRLAQALLP